MFGRPKFNVGRVKDGLWVVGGICRETKEVFLVPCTDNKLNLPDRYNLPKRTHGFLDYYRLLEVYDGLTQEGWKRLTVNHSYNFVEKHLRWQLKRSFPGTHTRMDGNPFYHFGEFLWCKKSIIDSSKDMLVLLKQAASLYPPPKYNYLTDEQRPPPSLEMI
ncbi:hypothetical protein RF11_11330 [Thelohanellus kitauei]|uniref:ISXO2-like transposase domain-containing protein n=1 Tax=Thelohanellus kitauei TaxID=669202 RepID=A0A0C2MQR0_THEKT|nr:hypothetical protein RF11_11330 [Thelohanellus kitauei]